MEARILRMAEVQKLVGLHKSTIYRLIDANEFPKPIKLGPNSVGWLREEIDKWIATRERVPRER